MAADPIHAICDPGPNPTTDLLESAASHTLASDIENLKLTGTAAINGTGNAPENVITGHTASNWEGWFAWYLTSHP